MDEARTAPADPRREAAAVRAARAGRGAWAAGWGAGAAGVAAGTRGSAVGVVLAVALAVVLVAVLVRGRRRRRGGSAVEPVAAPSLPAWLGVVAVALTCYLVVGLVLTGGLLVPNVLVLVVLAGSSGAVALWRPWRTDERAVRAQRPAAAVVRARADEDGGVRLARWARAAGVRLPLQPAFDLLLAGLPEGLELWVPDRLHRAAHLLALVPWADVALHAERSAALAAGWRAVMTLHGPAASAHARAVPRPRRAHPVGLVVYDRSLPVTGRDAVEAAIARLRPPVTRPAPD